MNHYYIQYQENDFTHTTPEAWKQYGVNSFKNLLYFLGYPREDSMSYLDNAVGYETFEKKTILQLQDTPCEKFYFIINGGVKITSVKSGIPTTFGLFNEGNLAGSIFDFFENTPSQYTIETCSDTKTISMDKHTYLVLSSQMDMAGLQKLLFNLHQNFLKYVMWFNGYQSLSSAERIMDLHQKFPEIIHAFKDEAIASLLGMRRETYSRMKKELF